MSNLRKFTEACAGFATLGAILYVIRQYMTYSDKTVESTIERLKLFFGRDATRDYSGHLLLIALFILAISASFIFKRLPELSFFFSALPLLCAIYLYDANKLYENPSFFFCLSIIQIAGNIFDSLKISKDGRKYSPVFTSFFASAVPLLCSLIVIWRKNVLTATTPEKPYPFDRITLLELDSIDLSIFKKIAIMYGIILLISLILRGVHFIDLALSLVPLCFVIYNASMKALGPHYEIIIVSAILCTVTHLCLTIGGRGDAEDAGDAGRFSRKAPQKLQ